VATLLPAACDRQHSILLIVPPNISKEQSPEVNIYTPVTIRKYNIKQEYNNILP
jgi:hypothetical protein